MQVATEVPVPYPRGAFRIRNGKTDRGSSPLRLEGRSFWLVPAEVQLILLMKATGTSETSAHICPRKKRLIPEDGLT